ncbi:unnamed protein product [Cyclocybe aegerita]|uniref:Uncharacterized protein n=1 Tax=Cyclocybe aegerita TaxID=1973307 RepID=A0A8S0VRS0_CYCAE|nr:unnamed protein product [Cyclocybe aegerita]
MYSATQASSSSRSNVAVAIDSDAIQTPQMPLAGSSQGPIAKQHTPNNSPESVSSNEALSDLDINIPCSQTQEPTVMGMSTSHESRPPIPSSQSRGHHSLPSTYLALARTIGEIQELYELEVKQGEEIKDLSEQLFAAAWMASMSRPRDIQYRCLGQITDLLGEGVGQLAYLDGRHLRLEGKLPERPPLWDLEDLVPAPVFPRRAEQKRHRDEVVSAESHPSRSLTAAATEIRQDGAIRPVKHRRLETEELFNSEEVKWIVEVFEEEGSGSQDDQGDETDPDTDGTEPDDDAEDPTAPRASTSSTSSSKPASSSADATHPVATQKPRGLQRAASFCDLSFNGSLSIPYS